MDPARPFKIDLSGRLSGKPSLRQPVLCSCSLVSARVWPAEVLSALRGLVRGGKFDQAAATDLIVDLMVLPVDRWHMSPLLPRMWELRDNLTPCDAAYVALAELTGATLVTGDERIAAAPGPRCDILVIK